MASIDTTDLELLATVAGGGRKGGLAIEKLYLRYAQRFFAFLCKRGVSRSDAEEIIQNTFVNLMSRSLNIDNIQSAPAYLWRCLKHAWQDNMRRDDHNPISQAATGETDSEGIVSLIERLVDEKRPVEDTLGLNDCLARMWSQFRSDNEDRATALYLAVVEGWTREDLADYLDRSYGATREYLSQCRKKFVECFALICPDYVPGKTESR